MSQSRVSLPPVHVSTIYREVFLDKAGVHLVVLAPDSGAAQAVVEGEQVETVGILTVLDLVTGTCLGKMLSRM